MRQSRTPTVMSEPAAPYRASPTAPTAPAFTAKEREAMRREAVSFGFVLVAQRFGREVRIDARSFEEAVRRAVGLADQGEIYPTQIGQGASLLWSHKASSIYELAEEILGPDAED